MKKIYLFAFLLAAQFGYANNYNPTDTLKSAELSKKADKEYAHAGYSVAVDKYIADGAAMYNTGIQGRIADSYRLNADYEAAEIWYARMIGQATKADDFLHYAQVLQINGKCNEAEEAYAKYADMMPAENRIKLASCNDLSVIPESRKTVVKNMEALNTAASEFSAIPTQQGIYFTASRRKNGVAKRNDKWTNANFTDLYFTQLDENNEVVNLRSAGAGVNGKYHDGTAVFDVEETTMYFAKNNPKVHERNNLRYLDLYSSVRRNGEWTRAKKMNINVPGYTSCHPTLSPDQSVLYFASNRPGGMGGMDIWKSEWKNGEWQTPVNLGAEVNSKGNEVFPFIAKDGKLYIASEGHGGLGGLDIYRTTMSDNKWTEPQNLGKPFNSPKDDFAFYTDKNNEKGWFASNRDGGKGDDDLYTWEGGLKEVKPAVIMRNICVTDEETKKLINGSTIEVTMLADTDASNTNNTPVNGATINRDCGDVVLSLKPTQSNANEYVLSLENAENTSGNVAGMNGTERFVTDAKGQISYPVVEGMNYKLTVKKPGYTTETVMISAEALLNIEPYCIDLTPVKKPAPKPAPKPIVKPAPKPIMNSATATEPTVVFKDGVTAGSLKKYFLGSENAEFRKGQIIKLTNLYYDYNKASIRKSAEGELDYVYGLLMTYPSLELNLLSHTDSRGTKEYNERLSSGRAVAAMNYLIRKGIPSSRLSARGLGESSPVNRCSDGVKCSEEEHQLNRRTEIQVRAFSAEGVRIED